MIWGHFRPIYIKNKVNPPGRGILRWKKMKTDCAAVLHSHVDKLLEQRPDNKRGVFDVWRAQKKDHNAPKGKDNPQKAQYIPSNYS